MLVHWMDYISLTHDQLKGIAGVVLFFGAFTLLHLIPAYRKSKR